MKNNMGVTLILEGRKFIIPDNYYYAVEIAIGYAIIVSTNGCNIPLAAAQYVSKNDLSDGQWIIRDMFCFGELPKFWTGKLCRPAADLSTLEHLSRLLRNMNESFFPLEKTELDKDIEERMDYYNLIYKRLYDK